MPDITEQLTDYDSTNWKKCKLMFVECLTWKPAAFSNVAILWTKPKAENTWMKKQELIHTSHWKVWFSFQSGNRKISGQYIIWDITDTEIIRQQQGKRGKKNFQQMRNKCRMTPELICVTLERSVTYMIIIPNCLQQKFLNMRDHHLWFNRFQ